MIKNPILIFTVYWIQSSVHCGDMSGVQTFRWKGNEVNINWDKRDVSDDENRSKRLTVFNGASPGSQVGLGGIKSDITPEISSGGAGFRQFNARVGSQSNLALDREARFYQSVDTIKNQANVQLDSRRKRDFHQDIGTVVKQTNIDQHDAKRKRSLTVLDQAKNGSDVVPGKTREGRNFNQHIDTVIKQTNIDQHDDREARGFYQNIDTVFKQTNIDQHDDREGRTFYQTVDKVKDQTNIAKAGASVPESLGVKGSDGGFLQYNANVGSQTNIGIDPNVAVEQDHSRKKRDFHQDIGTVIKQTNIDQHDARKKRSFTVVNGNVPDSVQNFGPVKSIW